MTHILKLFLTVTDRKSFVFVFQFIKFQFILFLFFSFCFFSYFGIVIFWVYEKNHIKVYDKSVVPNLKNVEFLVVCVVIIDLDNKSTI